MSVIAPQAETQEKVREQLATITKPHKKSCQALGDVELPNHNDGEHLHKYFGIPPLHKYLAKADKKGANVAKYPSAFVDSIVHTSPRDLTLLSELAGRVDYDMNEAEPSHEALERYPPYRAKMLEWLADDPKRVSAISAEGGTD
ncbi:MAG: hypothetical protein ACOC8O_01330, partial [Natronomonas sp.]